MPTIIIVSFHPYNADSSVKAFFTVELDFGSGCRITLYDMKVVASKKNSEKDPYFIAPPQRNGNNDKWYNYYYLSPALLDAIKPLAIERLTQDS